MPSTDDYDVLLKLDEIDALMAFDADAEEEIHLNEINQLFLVAKKTGLASWRTLFKFLGLPEKGADLSTMAVAAVAEQQMRSRVFNSGAPGWAREALAQNGTLHSSLKKLRRQLRRCLQTQRRSLRMRQLL